MEKLFKTLVNWYDGNKPVSESVKSIGNIFNNKNEEQEFFDLIFSYFENYDESNRNNKNNYFTADIDFIIEATTKSLTSIEDASRIANRIDTYFYIYRRIIEYTGMAKGSDGKTEEFCKHFYQQLVSIFVSTKGLQPNICIESPEQLKRINIRQHLSTITSIKDKWKLELFLVLCKLSFQASSIIDKNGHIQWTDILQKVDQWQISLEDSVSSYLEYKDAFKCCPFDIPAFICLIQKRSLPKDKHQSPFELYISMIKQLNFDQKVFFEQFEQVFSNGLPTRLYELSHIASLLQMLSTEDEKIFSSYMETYSSRIPDDKIWPMFLELSKRSSMNEIMKNYFSLTLPERLNITSFEIFKKYYQSIKDSLKEKKDENYEKVLEILDAVLYAFINKQLNQQHSYRFPEANLKELLDIALELSPTHNLQSPSCLFIIRHLLFKLDNQRTYQSRKISHLFDKLNQFRQDLCENHDPTGIIQDEWLTDYLFNIPNQWKLINTQDYQNLCNIHQNNTWSTYIWSRIVYLSFIKSNTTNPNTTLLSLNQWLNDVKHDIYVKNDTLTIIFVKTIFEIIISKYTKSLLSLPNISSIIQYILRAKDDHCTLMDIKQVDSFIQQILHSIQEILLLNGTCATYRSLLNKTIAHDFLQSIDLQNTLSSTNPQLYKFPIIPQQIDSMISTPKPSDINIIEIESKEEFFQRFIKQVNEWINWFDSFIEIFQYTIEWFKVYKVEGSDLLWNEINTITHDSTAVIKVKTIAHDILKILKSFNNLYRLCDLFNCLNSFEIIDPVTLSSSTEWKSHITELKRLPADLNNTFIVKERTEDTRSFPIYNRQRVQWSLVCENSPCNIKVEYQTTGVVNQIHPLFDQQNILINEKILHGEFQTQRNGNFIITIDNRTMNTPRKVSIQVVSVGLPTCHLFQGVFKMHHQKYFNNLSQTIKENDMNRLIEETFSFIDKLLDGNITLRNMEYLKTVFHDKNIDVREEVKELFSNRSLMNDTTAPTKPSKLISTPNYPSEEEINQVCEWLRTYQYYSHLNIIIDCVQKFHIVPNNDQSDKSIDHLQQISLNESCSLKEISGTYKDLYESFRKLTNHHLQLIKTIVECSNIVDMMNKADLYSTNGLRRFQQLRDNLTTQFQLQEKNNLILNSWIMTYTLCEPFVRQVKNLEEFVDNVSRLSNIDESSLEHIRIVNHNMQIVTIWLSAEETTMLDNALITMEHIYRSGILHIHLRHLMDEQSYFEIEYSIDKLSVQTNNKTEQKPDEKHVTTEQPFETIKFILTMPDIDDHKRQLTFCNVDLQPNMIYKKTLLNEQLKLLQTIEKIYSILLKLEMTGHPNFQLIENNYEIHDGSGDFNKILSELNINPSNKEQQLEELIQQRTNYFQSVYSDLEKTYDEWTKSLDKYRADSPLLMLFSNRQIMVMIILLTTSTTQNQIQQQFLEKLFSSKEFNKHKDKSLKLIILCLIHYLQSLRITDCNLSEKNLTNLYNKYKIEQEISADKSLKQLCEFLQEIFNNDKQLLTNDTMNNESHQFLVTINSSEQKSDKIKMENDFDIDICSILLNIFNNQLPAEYQILWCSLAKEEDIRLFFARVRVFRSLIFVVMDIDKMHHRLKEILLNEQDSLAKQSQPHASIYYFSKELTSNRKGLRPFFITPQNRKISPNNFQLKALLKKINLLFPDIQIIFGKAGIGKTHCIKQKYADQNACCVSINDKINLSSLITSFLTFELKTTYYRSSIYLNISVHAPFEQLNRLLFSLFICNSLNDIRTGLTFSPLLTKPWKFIIEVPYTNKSHLTVRENFDRILPLLSILPTESFYEVTDSNYQIYIKTEEELVARFLKALEDQTIDRQSTIDDYDHDHPVNFDELTEHRECQQLIYTCIDKYASGLPRNKIFELSFTKFLYRRFRFFTGHFYRYNTSHENLGSTVMKQMINEARYLTQIDFSSNKYPHVYLVYGPEFSLHLLHNNWNDVPETLKTLFENKDPVKQLEYKDKNYYIECLSWLIDISYEKFEKIMNDIKFILTENFAYKLFHIHERKLTKLALIIEGETGVGKTFLLKLYSLLLNANLTYGNLDLNTTPRIRERTSLWLSTKIITNIVEKQPDLLNRFLQRIESKLDNSDNSDDTEDDTVQQVPHEQKDEQTKRELLLKMKRSLQNFEYNHYVLKRIWKFLINISNQIADNTTKILINELHEFVESQLKDLPLIEGSYQLKQLLGDSYTPTTEVAIEIFNEFLIYTRVKPLFYRLLIHPGISEEQIEQFLSPICQLAKRVSNIELVVFFDEVNTSSCLGLFKEMFMDGTLHGMTLPENIFFTAAINPSIHVMENFSNDSNENFQVHRLDYIVHQLPESLENLKVSYGILDTKTLEDYIKQKIAKFTVTSITDPQTQTGLDNYSQTILTQSILKAQEFCQRRLGQNSVSQREIQRCFNLVDFFWTMKYDEDDNQQDPLRCIALSLALIYYFRLPTKEDNLQRNDQHTPSREELGEILSQNIPDFVETIQKELVKFVNHENFVIPHGVAVNQAIREHIFSIIVSIVTRTPLCIIGAPGQSKTLSFQIVLQNLQGSQLSTKPFCKRLPAIDPFFCLGSKYSRSEDIASVFDRAIKREEQYQQNRIDTRCVVFLDEASLPDEKKMVLKVLHPYLDECKVAFVAVANKSFDAANANRMICIYRSLPSENDQKILAYGCLGLQTSHERHDINKQLDNIITGLCQGYRRVLVSPHIPHIFHDRDFIYMLRELRFELSTSTSEDQEVTVNSIKPISLLRALEDNFNGINQDEFKELVRIFFQAVKEKSPNFNLSPERQHDQLYRDIPTILRQSMKLDSKHRRLYGRYKLIIDESEDESAINLLVQTGIIDSDLNRTTIFRMSDFSDDINNELRNVEILSTIKLCMETGKTILMVNTSRIHGSLYDVFNQNFSIMATGDMRKIFSKVAIGPKTIDVVVHEDFQCIVHVKRSEFNEIPPPFLSRFQKYLLSVNDFYRIRLNKLSNQESIILTNVEEKAQSFIQHFGREYFYGLNENTLYSCLLSLIKRNDNGDYILINVHHNYTQLNNKLKSFIEQNPADIQQCLLRLVLSKLIQLLTPESVILKLSTFEEKVQQWLFDLYFQQQEHFNMEHFIQLFISNPLNHQIDNNDLLSGEQQNSIHITTKVIIFTRTSSYILSLNQQSKSQLFSNNDDIDNKTKTIDILNLNIIENSVELQERFNQYKTDVTKNVLITIIDGRLGQQRSHIPFVRQLIDKSDTSYNTTHQTNRKYFLMLIHSPAQDLYHESCFPSIFLHEWDFYFFDTCAPGSAFHIQKMLRILSTSSSFHEQQQQQDVDNNLYDLNIIFEDCLWHFCSRIQLNLPNLSDQMFTNKIAYEFYQRQTNTIRRVQCLKETLQQAKHLQTHIVEIYHDHLLLKKNSTEQIHQLIYQISKDILCGKRFDGLIDSIQSQTRSSFTNFVSNILKFIINDYGLETLTKLSTDYEIYRALLYLIDYQSFSVDDDQNVFSTSSTITNRIYQIVTHYSCIPQTPLYYLLYQRIKLHVDQIKLLLILQQADHKENENDSNSDGILPITTTENHDNKITQYTFSDFRYKLMSSLMNDKVLIDIISETLLHSYLNDLVRTFCTTVETSFSKDIIQCQQTIEFISRWLLLVDENDRQSFEEFSNKNIWLLAHVYTSFEYEQKDLISMYSACRIIDRLDPTQLSYKNLLNNNENIIPYLIFLNENLSEPKELVLTLFEETKFDQSSICLKLLPKMTDTIYHYLETKQINNSTVLIDLLQWIVTMLKSKSDITKEDISFLLKYLDESKTKLSLSMKQFLFDELINKYLKIKHCHEDKIDLWDRLDVLSLLIDCLTNDKLLENYQIPFHPVILSEDKLDLQTRPILFDLYFFYLQRQMPKETLTWKLINKGMVLKLPRIEKRQLIPIAEKVFKQLRDYFRVKMIALLLCEDNLHNDEANNMTSILSAIITELLSIDKEATEMNVHLQLFLSTIILKQSWSYLSNLLKSQNIQSINEQWTTTLYDVLHLKQKHNKYLQLSHPIEFTLSPNPTNASIFGKFHQPYEELRVIVETCAKNHNEDNQWKNLGDWIQRKVNTDPIELQFREIKVMLLLIIYYNYYCNNQLSLIKTLLKIIEDTLQLSREELIIFRAFIQPEEYLIGYLTENNTNNFEKNYLNNLFQLEHEDDFDLSLRHMLVNLLAMILLGGKESFLWTFTFQPLTLQNTYGFGSTSEAFIEATGVHYDCGCILTETGELLRSSNDLTICGLYTPPVYAAYFSTYGAMAWHLLLFDNGVQNLYENILTAKVIDEVAPGCQLEGHTTRAKICHFVCTRLLSTFHFLSLQSNQNDACILLTRCFERMACLTQEQSSWIKTSYKTIEEKYDAEQQYTSLVFYFIYYKLTEYKSYVNQLSLQSSIETNLQKFIDQMPDVLQFTQFKNELYCLTNSESSSLKVLQNILNSLDFLKITKLIYDLSEFYLLLHQTYTQLIERNEFLTITLEQLYNRAQKYYNHSHYQSDQNENKTHRSIIDNGILAVNTYHKFTDGLIRPGACDELQRFATISFDTPVHYLVKNENHDEGDIIMHILSVLGKHHNDLLDLVRKELADNQNQSASALKSLIVELSSKYISILQIANDNTGVISLNDKDCLWIEQLAQLSLVNNDQQYFFPTNSRLTFDFVYVQSQIIRTYLLLCRINYEHIQQKYQCHTKRIQTTNPAATTISDVDDLDLNEEYLIRFSNEQIENEWNHLKDMFLDKLYHGYNLLKQIALMLKSQSDNKSLIHLFEFVQTPDKDNDLVKKIEEYDVKDFQLCYINHVLKLYVEYMNGFQYLFTDSPPLLRTPIDNELNNELNKKLDENINNLDNIEQIQSTIEMITKFLNELKTIEDTLSQQSTQSLTETCEHLAMDSLILQWIPEQIKCENYVSLNIHLIRKRSVLQERKLNIEQKETKMWIEDFNTDGLKQKQIHHFHRHLNLQNRAQLLRRQQITTGSNAWTIPNIQRENMNVEDTDLADENIENTRIENTDIDDTNVENTPVEITNVENTNVEDTDTENTSVETINLVNTSIEQTNSENANVKNTDTEMINFESINLINTSIEHESNENTNVESTIIENEEQTRTVDHSNKKLEYLSLMELNIRLVPCLSSPLIEEIHEYRIEVPLESISMNKLPKFTFIHPDGKSITYLWKRENFCDRLENLFLEKKYDHNVYVVVDKDEIFVNFTDGNYRPPHQSIVEYHIIEKNLLIQIRFHFRKQEFDYLISSKCNLSSIIHRFIDHQRLRSLSSNTILCFFDHYGKCLENRTFNNHDGLVDIFVKEETSDSNNLCEITIQYKNNTQKTLFEPTTKWQEINLWLRTLLQMSESSVDNYEFLLKEEQKLIDQNEIISSNINQPIDVIDQNIITKVSFSYETNTYSTNALKSTQISSLLNHQNLFEQLNLTDISADDCTLTLGDTIDQRLLTKDDLQQSLATYSTDDNQSIHFQLLISIQIIKYDDNEQIRIPLTSRNTTIEQLLKLTTKSIEIYKYLALIDTKRILDPNETITNLNKTKFFLVKDNETCLISIEKSKDSKLTHNNDYQNDALSQRFTCFATIADIHQENHIDISHENLLYANDFIPSNATQLISLRTQPPIKFKLMNGNLPIMVTIENTLENKSIQFHCSNLMRIGRLFAIAHQLFDLINDCYQLNYDGNVLDDDTFALEDFGETQFQFQLTPKTSIQCSVTYFPSTIIIPCEESTLASTVVEQTLKKLHIPTDNINIYKLIPLIDDQVEIDFDMSIEEIQESFFSDSTKIFLEIKKKD